MRRIAVFLVVCLLAAGAATAARAEDRGTSVPLAERSYAPRSPVQQGDVQWLSCADGSYGRTYAPSLKQAPQKSWSFVVAAYAWASSIDGTSWADGQATDIDVPFDELEDKLDGAFMGYAEFRYCRWSAHVDGSFVALEESAVGPNLGTADLEIDQTTIDFGVGFAIVDCTVGSAQWGACCYPRKLTVDAVVGVRYWNLEQELTIAVPGAARTTQETSEDWWDPYVGARLRWQFAKRWGVGLYGDVGGFGIGDDTSELTWKVQAVLRFHVTRGFFLGVGYRALGVDRVTGSGAGRNGIDATYQGPIFGLGFLF